MAATVLDFETASRILGKMWEVSSATDEVVQMPYAADFIGKAPTWSKAVDFDFPFELPSGESVKGFRCMDFKDCTNHYLLNSKNETVSFESLSSEDKLAALVYMDSFADRLKKQKRQQSNVKRYAGYVRAAKKSIKKNKSIKHK